VLELNAWVSLVLTPWFARVHGVVQPEDILPAGGAVASTLEALSRVLGFL
jgi:hypothetical protein